MVIPSAFSGVDYFPYVIGGRGIGNAADGVPSITWKGMLHDFAPRTLKTTPQKFN